MNKHLDQMPCGLLTLSRTGILLSSNETLNDLLEYDKGEIIGQHVNLMLAESAKIFIQLYFFPLINIKHRVDEMYLSLVNKSGEEIPVLINASLSHDTDKPVIFCVIILMGKRNEYENRLLIAKKVAEEALSEKKIVNNKLEETLHTLQENQQILLEVNNENQKFKTDIQKELNLAKKIQKESLTKAISNEFIEIDSYYYASRELSGDNFGFYQINDHQYGAILLDVMGNGISSALISMSLHSLFQKLITQGIATNIVMKELDHYLHTLFKNNQDSWHYCTAIYLLIDTEKQIVEYTNAGHPPAVIQNVAGVQHEFYSTSPPIGALEGITFKKNVFKFDNDSRIFLYTDGVSELLGEVYLKTLLRDSAFDSLKQVKAKLLRYLQLKRGNQRRDDDQCFILIDLK